MELVSVIIPTYNRANVIAESINSVLNQTYSNLELIIVDDYSTDNTEEIIRNMGDRRLVYYKLDKNRGACFARNYGIEKARGELIAFQDSDDIWLPTKLEKQVSCINELDGSYGMVYCSFTRNYGSKSIVPRPQEKNTSGNIHKKLLYGNFIGTPTILCKRDIFNKTGSFDDSLTALQDWDLVLRISKEYKIMHLKESLVNARITSDSITKNFNKGILAREYFFSKHKEDMDKMTLRKWHFGMGTFLKRANRLKEARESYFKAINFQSKWGIKAIMQYFPLALSIKV
ncbi:glycosyltransferase family 2 protein [Maribellus sediminis]|uniref:glycosyltransferase family 2 protein n=1 Tax=Maribellus sediminis TaxID=2696285 RepID=UPI00142F8C17|nr:glycosyltransferase family A protein [Maribellus sediminis]